MTETFDLRGLQCPQLVLRVADCLRDKPPGSRVRVISTDPLSAIDIPYFLERAGHVLASRQRDAGDLIFLIECGGRARPTGGAA